MCGGDGTTVEKLGLLRRYLRALHCPTRWRIIELLGDGPRSTREIYTRLGELGELLSPSNLYYHLSELRDAGIIEVADYREEGGGAPEKVWKLKAKRIVIELVSEKGGD